MKLVFFNALAAKSANNNSLNFRIFFVLFLSTIMLGFSQNYTTTGSSTDWHNSEAWLCQGGPCANNPVPDKNVGNSTITILHDIIFDSTNPINLGNKAILNVKNGAHLTITSNLNVSSGGKFIVDNGEVSIGPGVLNNNGMISLNKAVLTKNGNLVNETEIIISNSCIRLTAGNFVNNGSLVGDGNIKVENGNINNYGTWSSDLKFYFSRNATGLSGSPISNGEIDQLCHCILNNCDIVPGYPTNTKTNKIIGSELTSLNENYVSGENLFPDLFTINGSDAVLLKIVVNNGSYADVIAFLDKYNIPSTDYFVDYYNFSDDQLVITVFFPIENLLDLNDETDIINQVYPASRPFSNIGLVDSQGDKAQRSELARKGWNLTGENIKVGVISDSYDRKSGVIAGSSTAVNDDVTFKDLPGTLNPIETKPVNVILDYPFGPASDEGRAMLQIVHDVAPKAELYFRTGYISEGNMAAGIADLVEKNCDVIIDDLTYLSAPIYRDGIIANAINDAADLGVQYFTSAGNFGNKSYEAIFTPSVSNPNRHDFGGTPMQNLTLEVGQYLLVLQWDNDFYSLGSATGAADDMDIYLTDNTGAINYGFNRNNSGNDPVEIMPFTVVNPTTTNIVIERIGNINAPLKFKYVVFRAGNDNEFLANPPAVGSTIVGHANAEGAITVGAVSYVNTPAYGGNYLMQQSSSRGGLAINGVVRAKPDIAAPTGGETTVNLGGVDIEGNVIPNFFGTSASAPHAAGVAALILHAKQKFDVDANNEDENLIIRKLLTDYAIDIDTPGVDFASGAGFVSATNSVGSFSNPTPRIISLNKDDLDPGFEPGEQEFDLIIKGEFFVNGSKVLLRDEEQPTNFLNDSTLSVTIPEFIGNPTIVVKNAPNALTNGTDGGDSNTVTFFETIIRDVIVKADAGSRRYGEPNPEFTFTAKIQDPVENLGAEELELLMTSVVLSSTAGPNTDIGLAEIVVTLLDDIDPILFELYNFIPESGVLNIEPMPVLIQPSEFSAITYGDPFPEINFDYIFGEPGETDVEVAASVVNELMAHHQESLSTLNGISFVNGLSFVNGITYVDGEPTINGIPLVNKTFFVSDGVVETAPTVTQNGISLVNGDGSEKMIEFGSDLFDMDSIENGFPSEITNGISFVNGLSIVNNSAKLNGLPFVNGINLVNGISFVNGLPFVNGLSLINGLPFVNGDGTTNGFPLVNGESELLMSFSNIFIILSENDASTVGPVGIKPINVITSSEAGTQLVIPGGVLDTNFLIRYAPTELVINPIELTATVDNKTIDYGEEGPITGIVSYSISDLPYSDTPESIFEEAFTFTPTDGCTNATTIAISNEQQPHNYYVTYVAGDLTFNKVGLTLSVADSFILQGATTPTNFGITADGLICDDQIPTATSYTIRNFNGDIMTGVLAAGQYKVHINTSSLSSLNNYDITVTPGNLYVNPSVGCNDRIRASDICKGDSGNPDFPILLRFEYTNSLSVPIYIPNGDNNILKGRALAVNNPPEVFMPGTHTFDIYTNGDGLQWEITTYGCKKPSKSATGSNANICTGLSFTSSSESLRLRPEFKFYPNPVDDILHLQFADEKPLNIKVYNEIGVTLINRKIQSHEQQRVDLDLKALKTGLLFVEILTDNDSRVIKVIKR